jgi:hypothetical protein
VSATEQMRIAAAESDAAFAWYVSDLWFPPHLQAASRFASHNAKGLVLMPRGHAKCQSGNARVAMADGSLCRLADVMPGDMVVGLDGLELRPAKVLWAGPTGRKPMLRIRTKSGSELVVSPEHRLRTFDGWADGRSIEPGSFLAAPLALPSGHGQVSVDEASLLAYWVAQGCRGQGSLTLSIFNPVIQAVAVAHATALGLGTSIVRSRGRDADVRVLRGGLDLVRRYGFEPLTCGAAHKRVPPAIFTASDDVVVAFLRALYESDGSVYRQRGRPVVGGTPPRSAHSAQWP